MGRKVGANRWRGFGLQWEKNKKRAVMRFAIEQAVLLEIVIPRHHLGFGSWGVPVSSTEIDHGRGRRSRNMMKSGDPPPLPRSRRRPPPPDGAPPPQQPPPPPPPPHPRGFRGEPRPAEARPGADGWLSLGGSLVRRPST